jgi:hypothetical protein
MRSCKIFCSIVFVGFIVLTGCTTVKPWQRVYLNDPEMQMGGTAGQTFEDYVQAIRTGSTVAGSKKMSGGCGCN